MEKQLLDITWDKGVNFADPPSKLEDGEATVVQNWYPFRGGLRARRGWKSATTSVASGTFPTTRRGRGLSVIGGTFYAAHADTSVAVNEVQVATLTGYTGTDSFKITMTLPNGGGAVETAALVRGTNYDAAAI